MNVSDLKALAEKIRAQIGKSVVGQVDTADLMLVSLFSGGHILLEGPPGTAKTLLAQCFAASLGLEFGRIQFTPDLLPGDIVGTNQFNFQTSSFVVHRGPIFCELLLADEINRTPPKTQAALLEAMQEREISVGRQTLKLERPFLVMATQNPIEQEGTYALPEAQLDRFMLMVKVGYPTREDERKIMDRMTQPEPIRAQAVVTPAELMEAARVVKQVYVDEKVKEYIVEIVFATREPAKHGLKDLAPLVEFGASPRASIALNLAARAHAFLRHRGYVTPEDVKAVGPDVLRHRLVLTYEADAEEVSSEQIVKRVFEVVEVP